MVRALSHCSLHSVSPFPPPVPGGTDDSKQRADLASRALAAKHETSLRVYSTGDLPDVYEDSFMATAKPDGTEFCPTLILVTTRLGIDKINQVYEEALIATLQMPQSIGIAG